MKGRMMPSKHAAITACAIGVMILSTTIASIRIATPESPAVLVNQVGYTPSMVKTFLFQVTEQATTMGATFDVIADNGTRVMQDRELVYRGELWNHHYAEGNFTSLVSHGNYSIVVHTGSNTYKSARFAVHPSVYDAVLERAVQFYYYQRCGMKVESIVSGYVGHELCHADDGYWMDENGTVHWKDLSGGWHDAGDYGKYTEDKYNTQYAVLALARTYEVLKSNTPAANTSIYDTQAPDIIDEAVWGAKFLQKLVVEDINGNSRLLCGIFGRKNDQFNRFGYWGVPSGETDNVAGNGDDRMSGSLYLVSGDDYARQHDYHVSFVNMTAALMASAALAKTAWIAKDFDWWENETFSPEGLLGSATALHDTYSPMVVNATLGVNETHGWWEIWPALACFTELARWAGYQGNATLAATYLAKANATRNYIVSRFDTGTNSRWWEPNMALLSCIDHDIAINGTLGADLVPVLSAYANRTLHRDAGGQDNFFSMFKENGYYFHYWGANIGISLPSAIASIAANELDNATWRTLAEDNVIHWIMGRNPLDICQVESLGTRNLPLYHHRYASIPGNPRGALPGCVPNGVARPPPIASETWTDAPDLPWFDMKSPNPERPDLADFRSNEAYITDNAGFLIGFSTYLAETS